MIIILIIIKVKNVLLPYVVTFLVIYPFFASTGTNGLKEANNSDTVNKVYNLFLRNFLHSFGCSFLQTYGLVTFKTPHPFRTKISQLSVEKSLTNYCEVKAVE